MNPFWLFQSQCATAAEMLQARCNHSFSDPAITPQKKTKNTYQTRSANNARGVARNNLEDDAANPYPLAIKPRDIQPNKRIIN